MLHARRGIGITTPDTGDSAALAFESNDLLMLFASVRRLMECTDLDKNTGAARGPLDKHRTWRWRPLGGTKLRCLRATTPACRPFLKYDRSANEVQNSLTSSSDMRVQFSVARFDRTGDVAGNISVYIGTSRLQALAGDRLVAPSQRS
jgi:hypothetical protein